MALCNSPNPSSPATVRAFLRSDMFTLTDATGGIQEFLSQRFGNWMRRHERGLIEGNSCGDAADVWAAWSKMLRDAVVDTGRYTYNADDDKFVPVSDEAPCERR
jgi:hypothetical protein